MALKLRPGVLRFAEALERRMRKHDLDKHEWDWITYSPEAILEEFDTALGKNNIQAAHRKTIDLGFFAMRFFAQTHKKIIKMTQCD